MGATDLGLPVVGPPAPPAPRRLEVRAGDRRLVLHVLDAGLACCSVEVAAALLAGDEVREPGVLPPADPDAVVDVLVVAGTVSRSLAPALQRVHASLPSRPRVVSFGACCASGGPYWDSYSVLPGLEGVVPVDLVVPGCPPPPEALLDALLRLADEVP